MVMERTKSDHCPIILKDEDKNFGPKPFKFFDVWLEKDGVDKIIEDTWSSCDYKGLRMDYKFVFKLKKIKEALRVWSKEFHGKLDGEIEVQKNIALNLELKGEIVALDEIELSMWKEARNKWFEKEKIKTSMIRQKSRTRWTLEGDENTRFFHSEIQNKNNKSNIHGLIVNGVWTKIPHEIKRAAHEHLQAQFVEPDSNRPSLEELRYPSISTEEAAALDVCFLEDEI
ncbi:uncharacterized protein [Rutidosis leptorrhynchoides]|uniref:uncharacterized protein n=1 Tax=Rutidosis leptorrhynchoides TaxID=125765 RepID=UPI003A99C5A5